VSNACSSDTITHFITVTVTGVEEASHTIDVRLYPNPNAGVFDILMEPVQEHFNIEIYDILGHLHIGSHLAPNPSGRHRIEMEDAPAGVYSVVISGGDIRRVIKFILL
jgi:hypothetical protein